MEKKEKLIQAVWAEESDTMIYIVMDENGNKRLEIREGDKILASATLQPYRCIRLANAMHGLQTKCPLCR